MQEVAPYLVVGSGCTGATAARALLDAGAAVSLVDVGHVPDCTPPPAAGQTFQEIRSTRADQHRLFLGDALESLTLARLKAGAQLTPPRRHIVKDVERLLPVSSEAFTAFESLAYGGLGAGWGLGCNVFSVRELREAGLDARAMRTSYERVGDEIGVSGARDDATPYTSAFLDRLDPAPEPDPNARALLERYARRRGALNRRGLFLGRPALALLTRDRDGRQATRYRDLDFYLDDDKSAYRPAHAVDAMRQRPGFEYRAGLLALSFVEDEQGVALTCLDVATNERVTLRCRCLVLCCGALGTARVVLRSRGAAQRLPLLCNPYTHVPCVLPGMLGQALPPHRTSVVQLVMFHDAALGDNFDVAQASFYSYGSLLLFRLLAHVPLDFQDGIRLLRWLVSGLVIVGIHHPTSAGAEKRLGLEPDSASATGDRLSIDYMLDPAERARNDARERLMLRALRALGCVPLKRTRPPLGASIHYAGTLPFSEEPAPLRLSPTGRLHGGRRVYVADGSGFRYLPAKGVTLSLMANAHRVARSAFELG